MKKNKEWVGQIEKQEIIRNIIHLSSTILIFCQLKTVKICHLKDINCLQVTHLK